MGSEMCIRDRYQAALGPGPADAASIEAGLSSPESFDVAQITPRQSSDAANSISNLTYSPELYVLGTVEDLVSRSRDWMRGNRQRSFEMRLTGIAMASPPSLTGLKQAPLMESASILKTAWRAKRLHPAYARQLKQKLEIALPEDTLTANLELALTDVASLKVRAEKVRDAFALSIDETATQRLGPDLDAIAQIADLTSPRGALKVLEQIQSPTDLQRAKLLAAAGGDRAVALISIIGSDALHISRAGVNWSRDVVLGIIALTLALIILFLSAVSVIHRAVFASSQEDPII